MLKHLTNILCLSLLFGCNQKSSSLSKIASTDSIHFKKLTADEKRLYSEALYKSYDSLLIRNRFNGAILIAKNGQVLLEDYRGYSNFRTRDTITPSTPFHIASVSKTFTGMAVLRLWQEGKLQLEDSIQKFFPLFPYRGVTIKTLLNHRSGLPNYVYFMAQDTAWNWRRRAHYATNDDMLRFLIERKPSVDNLPDRSFHYCNTNFALLALVVEKVTGESFPVYMRNNVFLPLGMKNTFIFSIRDTATYAPSYLYPEKPVALENIDCIYGDKNVYSTVRDLFLWDQALYSNSFVNSGTLNEAIQPYSLEKPSIHNYGLGWRLMMLPGNKIVYHNGWWHGNNAVFTRLIQDSATVIITGNRYSPIIYKGMHLGDIFNKVPINKEVASPEKQEQ